MEQAKLAFIGAGQIASSLIVGLITGGYSPENIVATRRNKASLTRLSETFGVQTSTDNQQAVNFADVVILTVKPADMPVLLPSIAEAVKTKHPLVLSLAAGVRCERIRAVLGRTVPLVRCMPNTPSVVQLAATGLYAGPGVTEQQRSLAESILRAVGTTLWVEHEADMDTVTALSGSGPAYFLRIMEALKEAGKTLGLSEQAARLLTLQTAWGTASMAMGAEKDLKALRNQVTSPGGTTAAGLAVLEAQGIDDVFLRVLQAARQRSCELANE